MTLDACIAHAIHSDLDIIKAIPEVVELPMEELEEYIEHFVTSVHNNIYETICEHGDAYVKSRDAAGLCATLQGFGIDVPTEMLLKMCQTIMELSEIDATFILDTDEGASLYHVKMDIDVAELITV